MSFRKEASGYAALMQGDRRHLHRIPEIGDDLPETKAYLLRRLSQMECETGRFMHSGITAFFDFGKRETLAFRTDMDALEIEERTGREFSSRHEGCMHACGHDGHMAMVLALADYCDDADDLPVNVLLIFEPAEESLGGAETVCESGILDEKNVKAVFGFHMYPFGKKGEVTTRPGAMMAQSCEIDVTVKGRAAHAAERRGGIDAVEAAAEFVYKVHMMRAEETPVDENTIISFGIIRGGTMRNIFADHVDIRGTMRAYNADLFRRLQTKIRETAKRTAAGTGAKFSVDFSEGFPPVMNNEKLYEKVRPLLEEEGVTLKPEPEMISDDFSFFGLYRPSLYLFLGTGTGRPLHTDDFDFDESVLVSGLAVYIALVNKYAYL
ncbi:MAG: M20 metallopeptidase family protein [Anaerovoracaceae bacterium]|jgi:amidohydrolase